MKKICSVTILEDVPKLKSNYILEKKKKKSPSFSVLQLMSYTAEVSESRLLPQAS